jgi:hypothetical protein
VAHKLSGFDQCSPGKKFSYCNHAFIGFVEQLTEIKKHNKENKKNYRDPILAHEQKFAKQKNKDPLDVLEE